MPRKRFTKRTTRFTRRRYRKKPVLFNSVRRNPSRHYYVTAFTESEIANFTLPATSSGVLSSFQAKSFALNELPNAADLLTHYDQYRIDWVEIIAYPHNSTSIYTTIATGQTIGVPTLHLFSDYDDVSIPSTLDSVVARTNCKSRVMGNTPFKYKLKPRANIATSAGKNILFSRHMRPNIDMADQDMVHYGIKWALTIGYTNPTGASSTADVALLFKYVYHYTCFNPR